MKKATKKMKYIVISGDDCITGGATIKELCDNMGVSFSYVYQYKHKNINGDGSWSFNYKGYNFTIYTHLEFDFLIDEKRKEIIGENWKNEKKLPKLLSGELGQ
jgi:hypothetical protein